MTITYKIRLVRNGNETEIEGDKKFVVEMLKQLEPAIGGADKSTKAAREGASNKAAKDSVPKGKITSIREFIQQLDFKKHTDITLAFGYFIEHYTDATEFTPADINNCYYEAKIEASNTSQMIIQNIKRGFVMLSKGQADSGRKRYTLTRSGEKHIEDALGTS